jgi:hypothetical protein
MKNPGPCDIENTVTALEQAIENRKTEMENAKRQPGPSPVVSHLFSEILGRAGGSYGQIGIALEQGGELARDFIKKAQQSVEKDPWTALRQVAVYSFGIGLFLSVRHRKPPRGKK